MGKLGLLVTILLCTLYTANAQEQPAPAAAEQVVVEPTMQLQAPTLQSTKPENEYYADPFSLVSQFDPEDIDEEEEATERFYEYGRLIHISLSMYAAQPRGPMASIYTMGWMIGTRFTYFLDWDLGFTFNIAIGRSRMDFTNSNPLTAAIVPTFTGTATLFDMGFGLAYYPNFHDISKSIAWLNPSILFGLEMFMINDKLDDQDLEDLKDYGVNDPSHRVTAPSLFMGMGLEIPLLRNTVFMGIEFVYHMTFFPSYNYRIDSTDLNFGSLDYSGRFFSYGFNIIWNI